MANDVAQALRAAYDDEWINRSAIQERSAQAMWAAIYEIERLRALIKRAITEGDFCQECAVSKTILRPGLPADGGDEHGH